MSRKRNIFPFILLGLTAAFFGFGIYSMNRMPPSHYPDIHGKFSLHSVDGPVTSKDMLGKVGVIYFGYTHCPDVCPGTLVRIGAALKLLDSDELAKVLPVFITTDPDRDTPEVMAKYARHFNPHIVGLSGNSKEIEAAAKSFLSGYKKEAPDKKGNYTVSHASFIIIVRPDGNLDKLMSHTSKPEDIANTIRHWLRWT
ncbi:MAG: SCO family protein [Zetaproteobacteria bacterium]|nr:MAG: SCO family protein [Zetaproteobacteria bacterium]